MGLGPVFAVRKLARQLGAGRPEWGGGDEEKTRTHAPPRKDDQEDDTEST